MKSAKHGGEFESQKPTGRTNQKRDGGGIFWMAADIGNPRFAVSEWPHFLFSGFLSDARPSPHPRFCFSWHMQFTYYGHSCFAVEAGGQPGTCRPDEGACRDRPRLVLPAALSAGREMGRLGIVGAALRGFDHAGRHALAAAFPPAAGRRGGPAQLQRLQPLRRGLSL